MYKILISDSIAESAVTLFSDEPDFHYEIKTGLTPEELQKTISEFHGLIVRSATKVTAEIINAADNLKVIGRAGAGLDNINLEAASEKGIEVLNTPGSNSRAVAELVIGFMFSLSRKMYFATESLRNEKWEKSAFSGTEVFGKTLGLIGFGKIGMLTGKMASALGMNVLVNKNSPLAYSPGFEFELVSMDKLLSRSDFVSVHVPKTAQTQNLIGANELRLMKNSAFLINTARGGIVNEHDLLQALDENRIAGAALDVFETEPPLKFDLIKHPKVVATPHIGASSKESQIRVGEEIIQKIMEFLKTNYIFIGNQ